MKNPFADLDANNAIIRETIGLEPRKNIVKPRFYSMDSWWLYTSRNNKKSILDIYNAMNWAEFWSVGADGKFVHELEVSQWCKFMFGIDDTVRELFRYELGYDARDGKDRKEIERAVKWRNNLLHWGGRKELSSPHQIGILYLPTASHRAFQKLMAKICPNITTKIINGNENITNKTARVEIEEALVRWEMNEKPYGDQDKKFLVLMDMMGNRSLSVPEITFAIFTGDNPSDASFDQKTARVRTELGANKDAFVIDCSLSKNLAFHIDALFKAYAKRKGCKVEQAIDEFHEFDTIFKYVWTAIESNEDYEQVFKDTDYAQFRAHLSLGRVATNLVNIASEEFLNSLVGNETIDKLKTNIPDVDFIKNPKGSHKTGNGTGDNRGGSADPDDKPTDNDDKESEDEQPKDKNWRVNLLLSMIRDLLDEPLCMGYITEGEDEDKPLFVRWKENRENWIAGHAKKYGGIKHCAENWDRFIDFFKDNPDINIRLAEIGQKHKNGEYFKMS